MSGKKKHKKKKWKQLVLSLLFSVLMSACGLDIQTGAEADSMRVVAEAEAEAIEAEAEAEAEAIVIEAEAEAAQNAIDREQARQLAAISASQEREAEAVKQQVDLILDIAQARAKAAVIQAFGIVGMVLVFLVFILGGWSVVYYLTRKTDPAPPTEEYYHPGQYLRYRPETGIQIIRQPDRDVQLVRRGDGFL